MTLQELKNFSLSIYYDWQQKGCPEASDTINSGNIEIIKNYMKLYPNAKGYKYHEGFVDLNSKWYNFFCDWVFNGTDEAIARIKTLEQEYKSTHDPTYLTIALEQADGICLVWS